MNRSEAKTLIRTRIARELRAHPRLTVEEVVASLKIPATLKREVLAEHRAARRLQGSWRRRRSSKRRVSASTANRNAAAHAKFVRSILR